MNILDVKMIRTDGYNNESQVDASINLDYLRAFYPRHEGPGTRLTFADGKGFAVADDVATIKAAAEASGLRLMEVTLADQAAAAQNQGGSFLEDDPDHTDADGEPLPASAAPEATNPAPGYINLDYLRAFYPRHEGMGEGTRLTFADGGGFAITNAYASVRAGAQSLTAH